MYEGYEKDYGVPVYAQGRVALYKKISTPPIKWLIEGVLKERGLAMLYGASGSMKSYSAIDLACRMVNGMDFHGKRMEKGNVVYVAGEAADEVDERIDAWTRYHNRHERPLIQPWELSINKPQDMSDLATQIEKIGDVKLVIFDTLSDCSAGVKLNDPDDVSEQIKPALLTFVRQAKVGVLVVHHTGHSDAHERGAKVLRDMTDTTIKIKKNSNEMKMLWKIEKLRRAKAGGCIGFSVVDISNRVGIDNAVILTSSQSVEAESPVEDSRETSNVVEFRNVSDRLKHYVEEQGGRVAIGDVLDHFAWRRDNGKPKQTYYDALKGLNDELEKDGDDLILVPSDEMDVGTAAD